MNEEYDIHYVVDDILFNTIAENIVRKLEIHNETLRNMAMIAGEKTCKQVRIQGPALLVVDFDMETEEETI